MIDLDKLERLHREAKADFVVGTVQALTEAALKALPELIAAAREIERINAGMGQMRLISGLPLPPEVMVLAELLASIQMRFDADAAKIAERDAEIARLKAEREDRREDKREMRDEIAKLRAVVEAARDLTRWDWRVEVVRADLDRVEDALAALDERYGTSPWGTPAWLDAPDGPGWHWMRDPDGQLYIVHLYASADGLRTIHGSDPVYMRRQWQRVAPPREG